MKGFVLALIFSASVFVSSNVMAQDCCCRQPVRNTVRAAVKAPAAILDRVRPVRRAAALVDRVRPVRRVAGWFDCKRPVRRFFGRAARCCQ